MSYKLNKKIAELVPYEPVKGDYKIRLDANESPYFPDENVKSELKSAIDTIEFNRYPDPLAEELCRAFADFYKISPEFVTAGNGSDEIISVLESTFLEKGDKILVLTPDFSMYRFYSSLYETVCIPLLKDEDLQIKLQVAADIINKEKISMVIFSNPCNPTGQGVSAKQAADFVKMVNALVVLDEAYMDFWDQSLISQAHTFDNLIVLRTASKAVGFAALRLGFAVANKTLTNSLRAVKSPYNVNSVSQKFGAIIYKNKNNLINHQKNIVNNRNILYNKLKEIQKSVADFCVMPTCTNFVLIKTPDAKEIFEFLLENSIAIRYMGAYLRITAGTVAEISEAVRFIQLYYERRGVSFENC